MSDTLRPASTISEASTATSWSSTTLRSRAEDLSSLVVRWLHARPVLVAFAAASGALVGLLANRLVGPEEFRATVGITVGTSAGPELPGALASLAASSGVRLAGPGLPLAFQQYVLESPQFADSLLLRETRTSLADCTQTERCRLLDVFAGDARHDPDSLAVARRELSSHLKVTRDERSHVLVLTNRHPDSAVAREVLKASVTELGEINRALTASAADTQVEFLSAQLPFLRRALRELQDTLSAFYRTNRSFNLSPDLRFREEQLRAAYDAQARLLSGVKEQIARSELEARGGVQLVQAVLPVAVEPKPERPLREASLTTGAVLFAALHFLWWRRRELHRAAQLGRN